MDLADSMSPAMERPDRESEILRVSSEVADIADRTSVLHESGDSDELAAAWQELEVKMTEWFDLRKQRSREAQPRNPTPQ